MPLAPTPPNRGKGRPTTRESASASLGAILNLIRLGKATTRQELERESELGRAVVSDRLATLSEIGLVVESELGIASGGRAPRLVRFRTDLGCILVATLDQSALGVGIADLSGRLSTEHHEAIDLGADARSISDRVVSLFDWLIAKHAPTMPVWGISISVPGPVTHDEETLFLEYTPSFLPAWEGFPFVETLVERYGAPVWLRSSIETMTMGERFSGAGQSVRDMLFVKVGKRIGAGLICDGRLHRGTKGAAGLIGQMPVQAGDRTSTLDALAGSDMIAREGLLAAQTGRSPLLADTLRRGGTVGAIEVSQAAQAGDPASMEILGLSGRLIGHAVAMLANMLNPDLIILSGTMAQTNDLILAAVRETVYGESHPLVTRDLIIGKSQMGSSAGLVGAAMVAIESLFDPACLKDWIVQASPLAHPLFQSVRQTCGERKTMAMARPAEVPGIPAQTGSAP
ncbi:sugar kinase [Rhizobium rhizosphaerae]|uniref:Sugar kinase n=1 Tax=Xaviernesmea rhizosphaerae TaxID=1672749 RepID=A0A1Q9AP20_9HYPH|nr:ROK family protein [Xaviernesmea rhizosphaerae]OLP57083.1 sugar kinase [Xaviernesmea rhizosphaerae]OQP87072.1 sugar kinase [Xaviernesmea rhizosphaerae]